MGLGQRGPDADRVMRADVIALPLIDDELRLPGCREELGIQNFVSKRAVEALIVAGLPGRAR